jgi:branched-chain amino acid transport system substrate-binding protein
MPDPISNQQNPKGHNMKNRSAWMAACVLAAGLAAHTLVSAQTSVRIGYAVSKTGPNSGGSAVTLTPNYEMWVKDVNAAGGLKLGDRRVPIEVVTYDDRSSSEEAVRAIERLINQDKVDFILAPWGTAVNLAVGPVLNRAGYPHLATTSFTDRAPDLAKRWPNSFWFLGTSSSAAQSLAEVLNDLRSQGKIGNNVALASVADGFGIDLASAARPALQKAGFKLVYDKTYPVGTQDMAPIVNEVKSLNPDVFVAFSYPPDTLGLTEQSRVAGFNPKVFYTGVGTAFPLYKQRFGPNSEGVMGVGGWNADSPAIKDYMRRHKEMTGVEPDRLGSSVTYAALQMLQQSIERVGRVDRAAVIKELQSGTFETVMGQVKLENNIPKGLWRVGQWQDGEFYGIAPKQNTGARPPVVPKPAWKAPATAAGVAQTQKP